MGSMQKEGVTVAVLEENVTVQDEREESVMSLCWWRASCHCAGGKRHVTVLVEGVMSLCRRKASCHCAAGKRHVTAHWDSLNLSMENRDSWCA